MTTPDRVVGFTGPTTPAAGLVAPSLVAPHPSLPVTQSTAASTGRELNVVPESQRTQIGRHCVSAPAAPLLDRPDRGAGRSTGLAVRNCKGWQQRTARHQPSESLRRVLVLLGIPPRPTRLGGTRTWLTVTTPMTVGQPGCGPAGAASRRGAAGSQPTPRQAETQ